jgi:hypothetical protein
MKICGIIEHDKFIYFIKFCYRIYSKLECLWEKVFFYHGKGKNLGLDLGHVFKENFDPKLGSLPKTWDSCCLTLLEFPCNSQKNNNKWIYALFIGSLVHKKIVANFILNNIINHPKSVSITCVSIFISFKNILVISIGVIIMHHH